MALWTFVKSSLVSLTPAVGICVAAILVLGRFSKPLGLEPHLVLVSQSVLEQGRVWTLLSYAFNGQVESNSYFGNVVAFWLFGVPIERRWGSVAFLKYSAFTTVAGGLAFISSYLVGFDAQALGGCGVSASALWVAYAARESPRPNVHFATLGVLVATSLMEFGPGTVATIAGVFAGYLFLERIAPLSTHRPGPA